MKIENFKNDVPDGVTPVIAGPDKAPIKDNVYGIANEATEGIPDNRKNQGFVEIDQNTRNAGKMSMALKFQSSSDVVNDNNVKGVRSAYKKKNDPNTGDNDNHHLAPGPLDVMAHGKWATGSPSSVQTKGDPNTGDNDDWHLAPGPLDVLAHGSWKTGSASSAQMRGDPNTGDNDDWHLAPGPLDVMAHGKWKTGETTSAQISHDPNTGDNDDWHLAPGPLDVAAHGKWKTGESTSFSQKMLQNIKGGERLSNQDLMYSINNTF